MTNEQGLEFDKNANDERDPLEKLAGDAPKMVDSTSDDRTVNNVMRHEYKVLDENGKIDMKAVKDAGLDFHRLIETLETRRGPSRELDQAKIKIEESVMWAVKHITA